MGVGVGVGVGMGVGVGEVTVETSKDSAQAVGCLRAVDGDKTGLDESCRWEQKRRFAGTGNIGEEKSTWVRGLVEIDEW